MIVTAMQWQANGATPEVLAENVWRAYGYQTQVKNGNVEIWARHQVIAVIVYKPLDELIADYEGVLWEKEKESLVDYWNNREAQL